MLCTGTHEVLRVDLFVNKELVCPICLDSVNVPKVESCLRRLTPHSASANFKSEFEKRTSTSRKNKCTYPEISSSCNS